MGKIRKIWKQDYFFKYVWAVLVFLLGSVVALMLFFIGISRNVDENVAVSISENVKKQSHYFSTILDVQYQYLEGLAQDLANNSKTLISEDNMKLLQNVRVKTDLELFCIAEADGTAHYDNGEVKSVAERRYFKEGMSGRRTLSDPLESRVDGETRVVLGVPILQEDQVIGVLGGSYNITTLNQLLFGDIYDGKGFSFILSEEGTVVSFDAGPESPFRETGQNLFEDYERLGTDRELLEKIREDFRTETGGCVLLEEGVRRRFGYEPLGYNNWMVCYEIPVEAAQKAYQFIKDHEMLLGAGYAVMVLLLFGAFIQINNKRQKQLMDFAATDALTGVANKQSTEQQIQEWLNGRECTGVQAFLIMDIDFFKNINDQRGHAVGDEVLRRIGACLKETFRNTDVIGRIGGDEFVVFMKNIGTAQTAERKAAELAENVRELSIPELEGKTITTSIGLSCYPTHGNGYLDLYKHADLALYETKNRGRNGYTLYRDSAAEREENGYVYPYGAELNPLTGLYFNQLFFRIADEYIRSLDENAYVLAALDMEHFRLFNRLYGRDQGDQLLIHISDCLKRIQEQENGLAGYLGGDNFCILIPDKPEILKQLQDEIAKKVEEWSQSTSFLAAFGVVPITDRTVPSVIMYDWATIALANVYGNYSRRICKFEQSMLAHMEDEITLVSEVKDGIDKQEFTFYVQPQCNISGGGKKIVGGECLVRWNHPKRGLVYPADFVPVLERNGFVAELDCYIWKKACEWMQSWINRGNMPIPLSVNVSSVDIFSMDVPEYLKMLVKEHQLNPRLLKVEIKENACAEDDRCVRDTVKRLREYGFTVMIEDFGKGYASINMLKNVGVDVLKMDMRLMNFGKKEKQEMDILEMVFNMSGQMGLPIIMEGVETQGQEKSLEDMSCRYVQGYYYYQPMPIEEFEKLISEPGCLDQSDFTASQIRNLKVREFMEQDMVSDRMLNHMMGASAFYDLYHNKVEITSVNDEYCRLTGMDPFEDASVERKFWNHVLDEDRKELLGIFREAYQNPTAGAAGYMHYLRADGKVLLIYIRLCFILERDEHRMFYGSLTDVTDMEGHHLKKCEKTADLTSEEDQKEMITYYDRLPCSVGVWEVPDEEAGDRENCRLIFLNREAGRIYEEDRERSVEVFRKMFFKNGREFAEAFADAAWKGETRHFHGYSSVTCRYLGLIVYPYETGYAGTIIFDESQGQMSEKAIRSLAAICGEIYFIHLDNNSYRMIYPDPDNILERGNYEEAVNRHFGTGMIDAEEKIEVRRFLSVSYIRDMLLKQDKIEHCYRRRTNDGERKWCRTIITVCERRDGVPETVVMAILEEESRKER